MISTTKMQFDSIFSFKRRHLRYHLASNRVVDKNNQVVLASLCKAKI